MLFPSADTSLLYLANPAAKADIEVREPLDFFKRHIGGEQEARNPVAFP